MLAVTNWWPWCSKASVISALRHGYQVHVIVSDTQNDPPAEPFLDAVKARYPGRVDYSRDSMPRSAPADHALTRYDYLPELLEHYRLPALVTDADVIHRRRVEIPAGFDAGVCYQASAPMEAVERFANDMPTVWGELALWAMIAVVYVNNTPAGIDFARRIRHFVEGMRAPGWASKIGSDQFAVYAATRRLEPKRLYVLNQAECDVICSEPSHRDHAVWLPSTRADPEGRWNRAADSLAREIAGTRRIDF